MFFENGRNIRTSPRLTILITSKLLLFMSLFINFHGNSARYEHGKPAFENMDVLRYETHNDLRHIGDNLSVIVKTMGDPKTQPTIEMRVIGPGLTLNFDLEKAAPVAHHDTLVVSVEIDPTTGRKIYRQKYFQPDVLAFSDTFFHNTETGTIVSITQQLNGGYHVEGHLTHSVIIAPPRPVARHRREIYKEKSHTLYSVSEDRDRDLANSNSFHLALGNNILNSVDPKDSNEWDGMNKLNSVLTEWNQGEKESLEEEAEVDLEDDYLEVPSIFDSEEAWKAHQSQSVANFNFIHDKEEYESDVAPLIFHKADLSDKNRRNRRRRNAESLKDTGRKRGPESREAMIYVDKSLPIHRRFRTNVQQEMTAQNPVNILKENFKDTKLGKMDIKKLVLDDGKAEKHQSGIIREPHASDKSEYRILYNNLASIDKESEESKVNITFRYKDDNIPLKGNEISEKRTSFQHNKRHRNKRQLSPDTRNVPNVSQKPHDGSFRRSNADFVVEVAAIVDVSVYREFNYDWKQLQIFLLHFWQSVNARFQAMIDPKVQLKLKSINKIMFESMQPFIEQNRISPMSERVNVASVLDDFRSYVSEHYESNLQMPDHDIAVLLTGEDLCKKKPDGTWSKSSRGIAFVQGACISSRRFRNQTYDVGVAEVGRSYRGVLTTAHEVGHLLGAFHDGEKSSRPCPANSGHLMSQTWSKPYLYNRFSQCSRQNFRNFMRNTWYSDCLLSSDPRHSQTLTAPQTRPGQLLTLDRQCHFYIGGKPCRNVPLESHCGRLCCEKWSRPFPSNEPAADGTECGPDKMCFNGECLHKFALPPL